MARYADLTPPSDETKIRNEFSQATGQVIPGGLLSWYLNLVRNPDRNVAENNWHAVLLDVWENQKYHFKPGAAVAERPSLPEPPK
jgi:hypothetical protein